MVEKLFEGVQGPPGPPSGYGTTCQKFSKFNDFAKPQGLNGIPFFKAVRQTLHYYVMEKDCWQTRLALVKYLCPTST